MAIYHLYYGSYPEPMPTNLAPPPIDNLIGEETWSSRGGRGGESHSHNHNSHSTGEKHEDIKENEISAFERDRQQQHRYHRHHNLARGFNFSSDEGQERYVRNNRCHKIEAFIPDIDTEKVYPNLEFEGEWIRTREYWNPGYMKA